MIKAQAPGKLFLGGEYAVTEPGKPATLVAINQFVTVTIESTEEHGTLSSAHSKNSPVSWMRTDDKVVLDAKDDSFMYVLAAIETTEAYVKEKGHALSAFHLSVESDLDNEDGRKYGLGSSAAVTVATVRALCLFYGLDETDETFFKLAALSHLSLESNGSFGDLAASTYTGWIAYTSVDREWLKAQQETHSITELLATEWVGFSVTTLTPPQNMRLVVGWTGSPVSTTDLVNQVREKTATHPEAYTAFLEKSAFWVNEMIEGFKVGNVLQIQRGMRNNRSALKDLEAFTGVTIETPALASFADWAEVYSGAAKPSGAGGGDCGVALFHKHYKLEFVYEKWAERHIEVLPLEVYTK